MSTKIPQHLAYTQDHEWIDLADPAAATVGITDHAQVALGDVVYVELPSVGDAVTAGEPCGSLESTKAVSELFAPADGEVVEINEAVVDSPELVNTDPYGDGWLFRVKVAGEPATLTADAYDEFTKEEAED